MTLVICWLKRSQPCGPFEQICAAVWTLNPTDEEKEKAQKCIEQQEPEALAKSFLLEYDHPVPLSRAKHLYKEWLIQNKNPIGDGPTKPTDTV